MPESVRILYLRPKPVVPGDPKDLPRLLTSHRLIQGKQLQKEKHLTGGIQQGRIGQSLFSWQQKAQLSPCWADVRPLAQLG